ncbi:MAG: hypothetical protein J6W24_06390 [Prevotella sp.]|nr:hypothetical protein [Prevotella sp.]
MKYTREQVKSMTPDEYESAICEELNANGFRHEFRGEAQEYYPDRYTFELYISSDIDAVNYLKQLGLVDNGKCPICSTREDDLVYRMQNYRSGATYHVCKTCYKRYSRGQKKAKGCCFLIIVAVVLIIFGIVMLFS